MSAGKIRGQRIRHRFDHRHAHVLQSFRLSVGYRRLGMSLHSFFQDRNKYFRLLDKYIHSLLL